MRYIRPIQTQNSWHPLNRRQSDRWQRRLEWVVGIAALICLLLTIVAQIQHLRKKPHHTEVAYGR